MAGDVTRNFIMRAKTEGVAHARGELKGLASDVGHVKGEWGEMGKYAMRASTAVAAVGAAAVATGAAITGRLGAAVVSTGSQVEQYRIQLNTVIRDTEKAGKLFNYLVEFGAKTPFELPGLIEAATQMEAFGVSSVENMTVVGDMAAAMNKDITQAAMAVTQFMQGESEMMKQFAISVADVEKELGHKMERRTIQGQQEALEALLSLMRKRFSGGMEEMSKSWAGMMSNMSDNWFKLKMTIAQGGVFDIIKGDLKETLGFVDRFSSEGGFEAIAVGFGNAFSNIHDVFFQPMFDNMDAMEFSAQSIAVNVENSFTRMALSVGDVVVQLKGTAAWLKTMAAVGSNVLPTGVTSPTSPFFQNVVETYQEWGDTSARLRQRTEDLALAQRVLAHDTSLSIIEFTRGAEVLAGLGTQMGAMRDKATGGGGGGAATTGGGTAGVPAGFLPDTIAPILDETNAVWQAHFDNQVVMGEDNLHSFEAMSDARVRLETDTAGAIENAWGDAFHNMARYQEVFTRKGMNLGRAINSFLIRGAGEVGKAVINALVAQARIKATYELAEAAASFAVGGFAAAAMHLGAAAKYGLVGGAAGLATAYLDAQVSQREEALLGAGGAGPFTETGGSGVSARGRTSGTANTVRTGQQINNFYITLTNNVGGDYITNEGGALTDAQQLQRLFDEGIIQVPQ